MLSTKIDLDEESQEIEVILNAQSYKLSLPSVGAIELLQDNLEKEGSNQITSLINVVVSCGLPEEVARKMPVMKLKKLIEAVTGDLKKS